MINPKDVTSVGFREVESSAGERYRWVVPADLPYFEGHFPGRPTLPAVAMIDFTLELVRRRPGFERAELGRLKAAKFTAVIVPGSEVEVTVTRDHSASVQTSWKAEWRLDHGDGGADVAANFHFDVRS